MKTTVSKTIKPKSKRKMISHKIDRVIKEIEPRIRFLAFHNRFFVQFFCRFFLKTYFPLTVSGKKHIPRDNSFIMVSNHNSHIDTGVLGVASGIDFTRLAMLAARDYWFENRIRRSIVYFFFNLIPIERKIRRDRHYRSSFRLTTNFCKKFLNQDRSAVIIYPEGTRSKDGEIQNFKTGMAKLAVAMNVPVVPVYIRGTYQAFSRHSWFPKPTKILAVIGKPLYPPVQKKSSKEILLDCQIFTAKVRQEIVDLKKIHG